MQTSFTFCFNSENTCTLIGVYPLNFTKGLCCWNFSCWLTSSSFWFTCSNSIFFSIWKLFLCCCTNWYWSYWYYYFLFWFSLHQESDSSAFIVGRDVYYLVGVASELGSINNFHLLKSNKLIIAKSGGTTYATIALYDSGITDAANSVNSSFVILQKS